MTAVDPKELKEPGSDTRKAVVDQLMTFWKEEPKAYSQLMAELNSKCQSTRCGLPQLVVSEVPPIAPEEAEAFAAKHVNSEYHHDSDVSTERFANSTDIQYTRWDWTIKNTTTYVNVMRAAGHGDDAIQGVFDGRPLCWKDKALWDEFCAACGAFQKAVAAEKGWTLCRMVHTGSAVPGFSQNPAKGFRDLPSKITNPAKSDVDICIVANGVNNTFMALEQDDTKKTKRYPSTTGYYNKGMRFAVKFDMKDFSKAVDDFYKTWSAKLPGGLQLTFAEDDQGVPPWEMYIPAK